MKVHDGGRIAPLWLKFANCYPYDINQNSSHEYIIIIHASIFAQNQSTCRSNYTNENLRIRGEYM